MAIYTTDCTVDAKLVVKLLIDFTRIPVLLTNSVNSRQRRRIRHSALSVFRVSAPSIDSISKPERALLSLICSRESLIMGHCINALNKMSAGITTRGINTRLPPINHMATRKIIRNGKSASVNMAAEVTKSRNDSCSRNCAINVPVCCGRASMRIPTPWLNTFSETSRSTFLPA